MVYLMFTGTKIRGELKLRAVVQRVLNASVKVNDEQISETNKGLLVFIGTEESDNENDIKYMAEKICNLRIFEDDNGKMNLSLIDVKGEILIVSQFTLFGDCRRGRRPSFSTAARPETAKPVYEAFVMECSKYINTVKTGRFQTDMKVSLVNDGPVTMLIDSKRNF